jgi:hypothetical protein
MGFFEKQFRVWNLKVPLRLVSLAVLITLAKLFGSLIVYAFLNVGSSGTFWVTNYGIEGIQNQVFQNGSLHNSAWLSLFFGWDSAWYLSILTYGYHFSTQSYAFFPGFPLFGGTVNLGLQNPAVSLAFSSLLFGVLWVPVYQLVAELYLSKPVAFLSTLIFAFCPYVFLFTTVAYSESLLLFFMLLSWLLFKKGKIFYSSISAVFAVISRSVGILIIIPMIIETLTGKSPHKKRDLALCIVPVVALLVWMGYCQLSVNDWFAFMHTTEWQGMYSFRTLIMQVLPQNGVQAIIVPNQHLFLPLAAWASILIPPFLIAELSSKSKSLTAFASLYFLGVLTFGAMLSLPRFMSILFPLWIALMSKFIVNRASVILFCGVLVVFFVWGLYFWSEFLSGVFVG